MTPDSTSRVKMERDARLHVRVECRQCRDMHPPILDRLFRSVAFVQSLWKRTVTQGDDLVFDWLGPLPLASACVAFRKAQEFQLLQRWQIRLFTGMLWRFTTWSGQ